VLLLLSYRLGCRLVRMAWARAPAPLTRTHPASSHATCTPQEPLLASTDGVVRLMAERALCSMHLQRAHTD
jgi:hypothetical protein